jgi:hypothetical protein
MLHGRLLCLDQASLLTVAESQLTQIKKAAGAARPQIVDQD